MHRLKCRGKRRNERRSKSYELKWTMVAGTSILASAFFALVMFIRHQYPLCYLQYSWLTEDSINIVAECIWNGDQWTDYKCEMGKVITSKIAGNQDELFKDIAHGGDDKSVMAALYFFRGHLSDEVIRDHKYLLNSMNHGVRSAYLQSLIEVDEDQSFDLCVMEILNRKNGADEQAYYLLFAVYFKNKGLEWYDFLRENRDYLISLNRGCYVSAMKNYINEDRDGRETKYILSLYEGGSEEVRNDVRVAIRNSTSDLVFNFYLDILNENKEDSIGEINAIMYLCKQKGGKRRDIATTSFIEYYKNDGCEKSWVYNVLADRMSIEEWALLFDQ